MPKLEHDSLMDIQAFNKDLMKIEDLYNPLVQKSRTDLGWTLGKNSLTDRLVRPIHKFTILVTKTNTKIRKLKTYDKVINNLIYKNKW